MTARSLSSSATLLPGSPYRRSGAAILLTALSGPIWNVVVVPTPEVSLTFGRLLVVLSALLLALDLRRAPRPRPVVPRLVWLLLAGLGAVWTWVAVNMMVWGCRCAGEFAGLSELLAVTVLAVFAATFEPRLRPAMVFAVVAGAFLASALTLGGIEGLSPGARNDATVHRRVGGPYGNPNYLGFALAFALPAILAIYRSCDARVRLLLAAALGAVTTVLLLSFSRGSLLAALAGAVIVLVLQREQGQARWRMIVGIGVALVAGIFAYPFFVELRRDATTPGFDAAARAVDRSGWDARAQGLIEGGPATMVNPSPGVLEVRLSRPNQGVSRAFGTADAGGRYELRFEARTTSGSQELRYALEDNLLGNGPARAVTQLDTRWRALRLSWSPAAASPNARVYIYGASTAAGYQIRNVVTTLQPPGAAPRLMSLSARLQGSDHARLEAGRREVEEREIDSRRVGIALSWEAFTSQPIRGIGWGRFNELADARTQYGRLPTHNEYLRFLTELGAVGTLLLLLVVAMIGAAVRRTSRDAVGLALLGMLTTGGIGLVFINGLVSTSVAIPLALAAAAACARSGRHVALPAAETGWLRVPALTLAPRSDAGWALLRSLVRDGYSRSRAAAPPLGALALRLTDRGARVITQLRSPAPAAVPAQHRWQGRLVGKRWSESRDRSLRALRLAAPSHARLDVDRRLHSAASGLLRETPALGEPHHPPAATAARLSGTPRLLQALVAAGVERRGARVRRAAARFRDMRIVAARCLIAVLHMLRRAALRTLRALRRAAPSDTYLHVNGHLPSTASGLSRIAPALAEPRHSPAAAAAQLSRAGRSCEPFLRARDVTTPMAFRRIASRRRFDHALRATRASNSDWLQALRAAAPPPQQLPRIDSDRDG
ncbi:MAG: O-antigen ligase family protein [Actinomycetota bacterium]|nr:O-antigen ligase family protein [Actinomycetota bacterium]